jgi:hypothetical protein
MLEESGAKGSSLVEVVVAVGVLAVAVPLVFAVLARSGESGAASQAETRCSWIIPMALEELCQSRAGTSKHLPATAAGEPFPAPGEVMVLGFAADGRLLGTVEKDVYEAGVRPLGQEPVRFIARLEGGSLSARSGDLPLVQVRVVMEHPAASPAARRQKLEFHTRLP